jgi:hypothetical protein
MSKPWVKGSWLLVCVLAGCTGSIGASREDSPFNPNTPGDGDGDGSGGSGGSTANGDGDGDGDQPGGKQDPGRVTLHRLNRAEYANTVRDLLGATLRPSDDFPADDRGYGYDNIADVLSLSPVQLEMYFNAAQALIDEAMSVVAVGARRYEAETMQATTGSVFGSGWNLYSAGSLQQTVMIESAGRYRIAVRAWAQQGGDALAQMTIDVNALPATTLDVEAEESTPETYEIETELSEGTAIIGASFTNDFYDEPTGADRNLIIDWVEVEGPLGVASDNPLRARIMVCEPDPQAPETCLREVLSKLGRRAYRRPLVDAEVDALVKLATDAIAAGDDLETALRQPLRAMLMSPQFLFRVEQDPDPTAQTPHALSDFELASRLSYFLWSSMPDEALLELAEAGELNDDAVLREQVTRMIEDEKSQALLDNYAGQWLFLRVLDEHIPDYAVYPEFDDALRGAMRNETELFVRELFFGDETMDKLLSADFSFLNERLAQHYGISGVTGDALQRVSLAGSQRKGLLTHGGILMVTSYATRTSPVKRGKWVLDQLLCASPPPPPPGVEGLMTEATPTGSLRERMEAHRKDPVCASCHSLMDPIGFSFEHYDGIGRYRDTDNGFDIDPAGELPDGTPFQGPLELADVLSDDPRLPQCMAQHLMTYALGRGFEIHDRDDLESITAAFVADGYHMKELIAQVVLSDAFRMRRGEEVTP